MDEWQRFSLERLYDRIQFVEDLALRGASALGLALVAVVGFAVELRSVGLLAIGLLPEFAALSAARSGVRYQAGMLKQIEILEQETGVEPLGTHLSPRFGFAVRYIQGLTGIHFVAVVVLLFVPSWSA